MAPSIIDSLKKRQPFFTIIDKNQEHLKKPYFDVICFELTKDDIFYKRLHYKNDPFFMGVLEMAKFEGSNKLVPFKFAKLRFNKKSKEYSEKFVDPLLFRHLILMSQFIVVGDLRNQPTGYGLENYQIVEKDPSAVQQEVVDEYRDSLKPVFDYCRSIQFDLSNVRSYIFCHQCKLERNYTLLDANTRYKNQAYYVCKNCAGKEIVKTLKDRKVDISRTLKTYLRDLLKRYKNVNEVINVFNPNYKVINHPEATLVGIQKKTIPKIKIKPQTIFDFDLPEILRIYFESQKHSNLLPAQVLALESGLMFNQNELIVAATSAGKTMIGEIAGFSKILNEKIKKLASQNKKNPFDVLKTIKNPNQRPVNYKKFNESQNHYVKLLRETKSTSKLIYLVPIVALANMRFREYKKLEKYGINVAMKVGVSHISKKERKRSVTEFGNFNKADVIVGTYEAFDILLRSGHPYLLKDIKTIVVDEIQMLAEDERGFKLDGLISRLRLYLPNSQFLYLSATIPEPKLLASHYRSSLIEYNERPVEIERHLVMCMDGQSKKSIIRDLVRKEFKHKSSFGFKGQSIVFTNSRRNTEKLAEYLNENHISARAYHGGLNHGQRKTIEKQFEKQKIAAVITTAALAAGVDFAASQVIFHSLAMGIKSLSVADFQQMSGRAGRFKKHDRGKVYLLVTPGNPSIGNAGENEEALAVRLLRDKMSPFDLPPDQDALFSEVLATIAMYSHFKKENTGISASNLHKFHDYLFNDDFSMEIALQELLSKGYIKKIKVSGSLLYRTTNYGKAVAESFFSLKNAEFVRNILVAPVNKKRPPADPMVIALHLEEFNNVYVTKRMISDLSVQSQGKVRSNNLFSSAILSMTDADHVAKKGRKMNKTMLETIIKWQEDIFNCACEEKPYCDCGKLNVAGFIIDYRLSGMNLHQIADTLKDEYEIKIFLGDLLDYLEKLIYNLIAIRKIGNSLKLPPETRQNVNEIPRLMEMIISAPQLMSD